MELFERIELRRFVGREFLLTLWFESEMLEATLATREHGSFGFWLEGRLVLSAGQETTTIKGSAPGNHREAKESLLRGKLPDLMAVHLSWADHDATFTLRGETLGISGLKLPKPGQDEQPASALAPTAPRLKKKRSREGADPAKARAAAAEAAGLEAFEDLAERMRVTREIEAILEALYRDFLTLRLSDAWSETILPTIVRWTAGEDVDGDAYARDRARALGGSARARAS